MCRRLTVGYALLDYLAKIGRYAVLNCEPIRLPGNFIDGCEDSMPHRFRYRLAK
jgi:hypothetical protein